jgi:hypothetical protein
MELRAVVLDSSPLGADRVRLSGQLHCDHQPNARELWFDLPAACAPSVSDTGNPWLACLLPLAARLGEPLRLCRPVDDLLLRSARTLLHVWRCWYAEMSVVPIEADVSTAAAGSAQRTAALYSGGVDSSFTALEDGRSPADARPAPIDDLITIWGFDIPVDDGAAFSRLRQSLNRTAHGLGKGFVDIAINVRTPLFADYPWVQVHCGVLAAAGLVLERAYSRILIPSTHGYYNLEPGGSHPLTDPLFSTTATRIVHHGAEVSRADKLARVATSPVTQQSLHVCNGAATGANCGRCPKCYCTMLHLDVLGRLHEHTTFPTADFDPRQARFLDATLWEVKWYLEAVRDLARARGRLEVAADLERSFRRTVRRGRRQRALRFGASLLARAFATGRRL